MFKPKQLINLSTVVQSIRILTNARPRYILGNIYRHHFFTVSMTPQDDVEKPIFVFKTQ